LNDSGQIVLSSDYWAYLYQPGLGVSWIEMSAGARINSTGQVAGWIGGTPAIWNGSHSVWVALLIGPRSIVGGAATGINDAGDVVGFYLYDDGGIVGTLAFVSVGGVTTDLGSNGGLNNYASSINNMGQIVGRSSDANNKEFAFLYQNGAMSDINTFTFLMPLPDVLNGAGAINDFGQILAVGGGNTYLLTPVADSSVPEPSTAAFVLAGLLTAWVILRKA
jgi:probable HAF family extracellular repeat protein